MKYYILLIIITISAQLTGQTLKDEWVMCNDQGCRLLDPYYSEGVTMKWEGACLDGKANGYGKLTKFMNGEYESTYEGEFINGIREGKGKFTHKDNSVATGTFKNGQLMGFGTRVSDDGGKYEGEFVNYREHGKGLKTYANGSKFEGFFVADYPYTGKFTNYDGKITFIQEYNPVDRIVEKNSGYKPEIGVRVTEFFDENWKRCKQKDASYYRLITYESENKPLGVVKDFYITGQLQSEFTAVYLDYDDEGKNFHEGEATWYFKNGKIEQKRYYMNNKLNGMNTLYYDNGQIASEANYHHGTIDGLYLTWYKTGKQKIVARYEDGELYQHKYIEYDENGLGALIYNEDFRANREEWELEFEGNYSEISIENEVVLHISNGQSVSRYNYIPMEQSSDYSIESIIHKTSGKDANGYGIIFGFKDWNNYYEFLISEQNYFTIFGLFEGVLIKVCEWQTTNTINSGNQRNLLKVMKFENEFIFSINGEIVHRTESRDLRGNNFGIIAGGNGSYVLENIMIKEFLTADELVQEAPNNDATETGDWKGNGTGFFINENGYIATNYHVVRDANGIQVEYFQKGVKKTYNAEVVLTDKQNDLAIIQIKDANFERTSNIPYIFNSTIKDVGTDVFALGYPMADVMGGEIKFTDGKISSKTGIEGDITVYQISVPLQPGNSGGPLFDSKGNLVGITSSVFNKEYYNTENVSYAIKSSYLKNLIDVLPEAINLPNYTDISSKGLTEKIKLLSDYIPLIRIK